MSFHVAHNMFKVIAMRTNDHVDMAAHNAPAINFQSFMFLAIAPAIEDYIFILVSYKKVNPIYNSKRNKIKPVLTMEFVLAAHGLAF